MAKLIEPLWRPPAKHLYELARRPAYREQARLESKYAKAPRYQEQSIRFHGWDLRVPDVASFLSTTRSIFVDEVYAFTAAGPAPRILDCGANIGLSILYFKSRFPDARVTAFEADPKVFSILEHNVRAAGFNDVELVPKAVWSSDTTLHFQSEGADAGRVDQAGKGATIDVPAVRLRGFLEREPVDFLKIDIEGAEAEVLRDCKESLAKVRAAFVEHHSLLGRKQELGEVVKWFEDAGFRVHVRPEFTSPRPLVEVNVHSHLGMDLQLNLYFFRPDQSRA